MLKNAEYTYCLPSFTIRSYSNKIEYESVFYLNTVRTYCIKRNLVLFQKKSLRIFFGDNAKFLLRFASRCDDFLMRFKVIVVFFK